MSNLIQFLRKNFDYIVLILFVGISVSAVFFHEPWRDEAQAWLIARDIMNPVGFLYQMRYEGTPPLWHLILVGLNILNLPYVSMAIVHLIIISLAAFVLIKYSKFSRLQKFLILFGYFFIYEYNFIARNYALSVLLLFVISALYSYRFEKKVWYLFFVGLLATTNSHSFIITGILTLFYTFELYWNSKENGLKLNLKSYLYLIIPAAFILVSYYLVRNPDDLMPFYKDWYFNIFQPQDFNRIATAFSIAFVPIPLFRIDFWNSSIFEGMPFFKALIAILCYFSALFVLRKSKRTLILYFLISSALILFFLVKAPLSNRHIGFLFISWIFCLSISPNIKDLFAKKSFENLFIYSILLLQLFSGFLAVSYDIQNPFSAAAETKDYFIKSEIPKENTLIATYPSYVAESVLPYLPAKTQFYYLEYEEFHSYMIWNTKYNNSLSLNDEQVLDRIQKVEGDYSVTYLVINHRISDPKVLEKFELVFESKWDIITDEERYFIYKSKNLAPSYAFNIN